MSKSQPNKSSSNLIQIDLGNEILITDGKDGVILPKAEYENFTKGEVAEEVKKLKAEGDEQTK